MARLGQPVSVGLVDLRVLAAPVVAVETAVSATFLLGA